MLFRSLDQEDPLEQDFQLFLPEKFHGQKSLVGYSPWGCKQSDMTEHTHKETRRLDEAAHVKQSKGAPTSQKAVPWGPAPPTCLPEDLYYLIPIRVQCGEWERCSAARAQGKVQGSWKWSNNFIFPIIINQHELLLLHKAYQKWVTYAAQLGSCEISFIGKQYIIFIGSEIPEILEDTPTWELLGWKPAQWVPAPQANFSLAGSLAQAIRILASTPLCTLWALALMLAFKRALRNF